MWVINSFIKLIGIVVGGRLSGIWPLFRNNQVVVVADGSPVANDALGQKSAHGVVIHTCSGCDQHQGNPDPEEIQESIAEKSWHGRYSIEMFCCFFSRRVGRWKKSRVWQAVKMVSD